MKSGYVVSGNQKTGRLMQVGGEQYVGERMNKGGRLEEKKFQGRRAAVLISWQAWKEETADKAFIRSKRSQLREQFDQENAEIMTEILQEKSRSKKDEQMAQQQQQRKPAQRFMYLLAFQGQRSTKGIAVFESMEQAVDYSDALTVALDATGQEGKYVVDEIPVWGVRVRGA